MRRIITAIIFIFFSFFLSAEGYKGTLPDLNSEGNKLKQEANTETLNEQKNDILPLDKLTIPVRNIAPVDKRGVKYNKNLKYELRQLEILQGILTGDKSFKNFIAAANIFNLTTKNIINEFTEERFKKTNKLLSDINYDIQQIKNYWIQVNNNAPYVSYSATQGAYSGVVLNKHLNKFSKVLEQMIIELKEIIYKNEKSKVKI